MPRHGVEPDARVAQECQRRQIGGLQPEQHHAQKVPDEAHIVI
ncbi:Uncharacterised protein [Mycobacteroides abscessus subsp. abscessus]|nr:Uncharacterised protein [Mycobacteroides abscessus subsp. abscessus]